MRRKEAGIALCDCEWFEIEMERPQYIGVIKVTFCIGLISKKLKELAQKERERKKDSVSV